MKNSSRLVAAVAFGGATLLALTACSGTSSPASSGSGSASAAGGTIVYSPTSIQIPVLAQTGDKVKQLAASAGIKFSQIDGNYNATTQIQQVTQALDNHSAQSVWISPVAGPATKPLIDHATSLGVPILVQTSPDAVGYNGAQAGVVFQGPNFASFGTAVGEQVDQCVSDKGLSKPDTLVLSGPDTLPGTAESSAAAQKAYSSSVNVVGKAQVADIAAAQTQTQQLLIAHPNAKVVVALTDEGALGAINAYKAAGKTPTCLVLGGGGADAMKAQKAGKISTIVAWDFLGAVDQGWAALKKIIADPKAKGAVLGIPFKITK